MVTLIVKARDPAIKANRESTCRLVLDRYQVGQAGTKLLCFVDDVDCEELKRRVGKANRGIFVPRLGYCIMSGDPPVPDYVRQAHDEACWSGAGYSSLVYVHGSACAPRESLVLTLSHELRHFKQFALDRRFYDADFLLLQLLGYRVDLPSEEDALMASKSIAMELCGEETIESYAQTRIALSDDLERARWEYFLSLPKTASHSFAEKTRQRCQELRGPLSAMIERLSDAEKATYRSFDFKKPDWWEE